MQCSLLGLSIWSHQMKDGIFCRVLVRNQNFQKVLVYRFRTLKLLPMIKLHSKLREYLFRHTSALWSVMVKLWLEHSFSEFFNISSNLKKWIILNYVTYGLPLSSRFLEAHNSYEKRFKIQAMRTSNKIDREVCNGCL